MSEVFSSVQYICFRNASGSNMAASNLLLPLGAISPCYASVANYETLLQMKQKTVPKLSPLYFKEGIGHTVPKDNDNCYDYGTNYYKGGKNRAAHFDFCWQWISRTTAKYCGPRAGTSSFDKSVNLCRLVGVARGANRLYLRLGFLRCREARLDVIGKIGTEPALCGKHAFRLRYEHFINFSTAEANLTLKLQWFQPWNKTKWLEVFSVSQLDVYLNILTYVTSFESCYLYKKHLNPGHCFPKIWKEVITLGIPADLELSKLVCNSKCNIL